jgi:hypothetical protein
MKVAIGPYILLPCFFLLKLIHGCRLPWSVVAWLL